MGSRFFRRGIFTVCSALWLLIVLNSTARPAYGYVDPGAGLFLFQVIGSTFAGMTFLLRKRVQRLLMRFGRNSKEAGNYLEPR